MSREPIPTWCFVLVAVRRENRFLLVHEAKHGQQWYLPAGRVEFGEDFAYAAKRETLEETGIQVEITGVVRFEHNPAVNGARLRVLFTAEPSDDAPPKSEPDEESLEAAWFTVEQMRRLPLRGPEVRSLCAYLDAGGTVFPLAALTPEGAPFGRQPTFD